MHCIVISVDNCHYSVKVNCRKNEMNGLRPRFTRALLGLPPIATCIKHISNNESTILWKIAPEKKMNELCQLSAPMTSWKLPRSFNSI